MQNMWVKDPERLRKSIERRGEPMRRRMVHYALFAGCKSGRVLRKYLGEAHCANIIWEEASLEIGGISASCFPADLDHMTARILQEQPDLVLAFGKVESDELLKIDLMRTFLACPHPASRDLEKLDSKMKMIRNELDRPKDQNKPAN